MADFLFSFVSFRLTSKDVAEALAVCLFRQCEAHEPVAKGPSLKDSHRNRVQVLLVFAIVKKSGFHATFLDSF